MRKRPRSDSADGDCEQRPAKQQHISDSAGGSVGAAERDDDDDDVDLYVPAKQRRQAKLAALLSGGGAGAGVGVGRVGPMPKAGMASASSAAPQKTLLQTKVEMLREAKAAPAKTAEELQIEEERKLMQAWTQDKALMSVKELATGVQVRSS